jgi:hypothetical protein
MAGGELADHERDVGAAQGAERNDAVVRAQAPGRAEFRPTRSRGSASAPALVTDSYDERPWCNQEILWAKENRRPLLLMDIGRSRVDRSFPYAGNMTLVRNPMTDASGIELALMELLSEGLRCDLFTKRVDAAAQGKALALPRPPELADLAFLSQEDPGKPVVYPDPPLPDVETLLLQRLANGRRIVALSDF